MQLQLPAPRMSYLPFDPTEHIGGHASYLIVDTYYHAGFECDACGCVEHEIDRHDDTDTCECCWDESHFTCDDCGEECHNDDYADDDMCCHCWDACHTSCDACGNSTHDDDLHNIDGREVCDSCYENDYFTCDGCGNTLHNDDYAEDGYCTDCHDGDLIKKSGADPLDFLNFRGKPKDGMYLGVELEVECSSNTHDKAERTMELLGDDFVILKEDGSLSDGFEIVSAPSSLDVHQQAWNRFLEDTPRGMRSFETSSCGMHIHLSRSAISPYTLGKMLIFLYGKRNRPFLDRLSGRSPCYYAYDNPKDWSDAKKEPWKHCGRYELVNLSNENTIEIRMFKGTLSKLGFLKNVEFAHATVKFCQQAGADGDRHLTSEAFIAWVGRAPKVYPNLTRWLREKGYLQAPKARPVAMATA